MVLPGSDYPDASSGTDQPVLVLRSFVLALPLLFSLTGCAGPTVVLPTVSEAEVRSARSLLTSKHLQPSGAFASRNPVATVNAVWSRLRPSLVRVCERSFTPSGCAPSIASLRLQVVNDPSVNASVDGQGRIYVHTGLLAAAGTEAELAGVLAHEAAHALYGHVSKTAGNAAGGAVLGALVLGGLAATTCSSGDDCSAFVRDMTQSGLTVGSSVGALIYSPEMELEADQFAAYVIADMGYPPSDTIDLVIRGLRSGSSVASGPGPRFARYLRSHPADDRRLASLRAVAARIREGSTRPLLPGESWTDGLLVPPQSWFHGPSYGFGAAVSINTAIDAAAERGRYPTVRSYRVCRQLRASYSECPWWVGRKRSLFGLKCPNPVSLKRTIWDHCMVVPSP